MNNIFALYTEGLSLVFSPQVISFLILGTVAGIIIGALPGLSVVMGLAVITPLTFGMSASSAFALLLGVFSGGMYGGAITAIVAKIPGTSSQIMTTLDGYPMALRGEAGKAIGVVTIASWFGGVFSAIVLSLFAPMIAGIALAFSAQEYFAIAIFGMCIIAFVCEASIIKGLISGVIGLLVATIGTDVLTGVPRFTFKEFLLLDGLQLIPVLVGLYGVTEVLNLSCKKLSEIQVVQKFGRIIPTLKDFMQILPTLFRGALVGTGIGIVPGAGSTIAAIVSYGVELRVSKRRAEFGKGVMDGIAAPECANNAQIGGAMIPMLTLGIPGDSGTAVLIGALLIHGLQPGPMLFKENMPIVSSIFLLLLLSNFFFVVLGLAGARLIVRAINVPVRILIPIIMLLCLVGSFSVRFTIFDILVLIAFGCLGFLLGKVKVPAAPLVLGFILGPLVETGFRRGLVLSKGDFLSFFTRPISAVCLSLSVVMMFAPSILGFLKKVFKLTPAQKP